MPAARFQGRGQVEFLPIYRGQPLFGDIQQFAHDHGLLSHELADVAGRPYRPVQLANPFVSVSQILWAEAVFVRDPTHLARYAAALRAQPALQTLPLNVLDRSQG